MKYGKKIIVVLALLSFIFAGFDTVSDKEDKLREIATQYRSFRPYVTRSVVVTDSAKYSWTIGLCSVPDDSLAFLYGFHYKTDSSFISQANESVSPHGNKLYKLYIKDYRSYVGRYRKEQPVGQVIVKETWNVREIEYDSLNTNIPQLKSSNDGKWYTPESVSEVFIMYKEQANRSNDKGWNYGNVSIENRTRKPILLNDRKLSTCIHCHANTKYDRIFGVK